MTSRNVGELPHASVIVVDEDTMRYGDGEFKRVRTCRNVYDGREFECSECGMQWRLFDRADEMEEWAHVCRPRHCPECGAKVVEP